MRKRQCILSVYLVSVSHQCIASVPTFETIHPSFFYSTFVIFYSTSVLYSTSVRF